jgi:DNA end-binding protein Ku
MVGVSKVVIANKQHLALLMPCGPALVLNLLRWGGEIRSWQALQLPPLDAKEAGIREPELKMAKQLIEEMSAHWTPDQFRDTFHEQVMKLVEDKASAGHVEQVEKIASEAAQTGGNVVDLTELLLRSMKTQKGGSGSAATKAKTATKSASTKARKAA